MDAKRNKINWSGTDGKAIAILSVPFVVFFIWLLSRESAKEPTKPLAEILGVYVFFAAVGVFLAFISVALFKLAVLFPFAEDNRRSSYIALGTTLVIAASFGSCLALEDAHNPYNRAPTPIRVCLLFTGLAGSFLWVIYCFFLDSRVGARERALMPAKKLDATYAGGGGDGCFLELFSLAVLLGLLFLAVLVIRWMWEKAGTLLH